MKRALFAALLLVSARATAQDDPHGGMDTANLRRALGEGPALATAAPSADVPARTIRVTVVSPDGRPVPGTAVRIGVMAQGGDRRERNARTGADGIARFSELPTGDAQAYRVTVPFEGATYGAMPFRLEAEQGQDVRVVLLPTTRDATVLLQFLGQTVLELRPERVRVQQALDLMNMGERTYVFPDEGLRVRLPAGFTAFESQQVMTDQRIVPDEQGFRIRGSVPPGRVQLTWVFDLPLGGSSLDLRLPMPIARTFEYRVISDAAPGMKLEVDGFPPTQRLEAEGRSYIGTQARRQPTDPPLTELRIHLEDIPGPGPYRFVAIAIAVLFAGWGAWLIRRPGNATGARAAARERHRQTILAEVARLERDRAAGEIGPEYHARRREELVTELAALLAVEAADRPEVIAR